MNIGQAIRKYRIEKDIKAQVIYDKLGISQSTYSKIENNKHKMDINILKDIATVLEVDIFKLIGGHKIQISHANRDNADQGSVIESIDSHSGKLIDSLESQIELLKEQNIFYKAEIKNRNMENNNLRNQISNLKEVILTLETNRRTSNFQEK
ncbi:helix-turn-helix domain-containing protein [Flavobacterium sp.]|uniref:helix-turn-helix domain-containing protein n=1 Tax=Flavobacterium sp. TaxID=239 RepID=UPI00260322E8|nr:helix-turn-helix domain-containing protein [Flavobacterium sp.]